MKDDCPTCCGIGWVCENHPDKAFDDELSCTWGEGIGKMQARNRHSRLFIYSLIVAPIKAAYFGGWG
jgi:hypothetical protein